MVPPLAKVNVRVSDPAAPTFTEPKFDVPVVKLAVCACEASATNSPANTPTAK
jgi:hypothetical protein